MYRLIAHIFALIFCVFMLTVFEFIAQIILEKTGQAFGKRTTVSAIQNKKLLLCGFLRCFLWPILCISDNLSTFEESLKSVDNNTVLCILAMLRDMKKLYRLPIHFFHCLLHLCWCGLFIMAWRLKLFVRYLSFGDWNLILYCIVLGCRLHCGFN